MSKARVSARSNSNERAPFPTRNSAACERAEKKTEHPKKKNPDGVANCGTATVRNSNCEIPSSGRPPRAPLIRPALPPELRQGARVSLRIPRPPLSNRSPDGGGGCSGERAIRTPLGGAGCRSPIARTRARVGGIEARGYWGEQGGSWVREEGKLGSPRCCCCWSRTTRGGAIGGSDGSAAACLLVATGAGLPAADPLLSLLLLLLTELVARGRVRACCW
jgi:hypothetical protein